MVCKQYINTFANKIFIMKSYLALICFVFLLVLSCKEQTSKKAIAPVIPVKTTETQVSKPRIQTPNGMVWIPAGTFMQGAVPQDKMAMMHEKPQHPVSVNGFYMDATEVTNAQFKKFVKATSYVTTAERPIDWSEMKKKLPEGTTKNQDSILQPGSLLFKKAASKLPNLYDFSQWWVWSIGTNWRHPTGPDSSIEGKENHPVVHVSFIDALAYCKWAGRRLPTEAEWEYAARGTYKNTPFLWGDDISQLSKQVNSWEGDFPVNNSLQDGYERTAPVKTYPQNSFGLYEMAGNVWEMTNDLYNLKYYEALAQANQVAVNPKGATEAYNPNNPYLEEIIIKGGSFLCSDSYCASYRASSRMGTSKDSSSEHIGFRTVLDASMVAQQ